MKTARIVWTGLVFVWLWIGCGDGSGGGDCTPKTNTRCEDGVAYWVDSCGEKGSVAEVCQCACNLDSSACQKPCECLPDCANKVCGADGCGGSCSPGCGALETCGSSGKCECSFQNCNGTCCREKQICVSGSCCTPDCAGRICGLDSVCGQSCGDCTGPRQVCNPSGTACVVQLDGADEALHLVADRWRDGYWIPMYLRTASGSHFFLSNIVGSYRNGEFYEMGSVRLDDPAYAGLEAPRTAPPLASSAEDTFHFEKDRLFIQRVDPDTNTEVGKFSKEGELYRWKFKYGSEDIDLVFKAANPILAGGDGWWHYGLLDKGAAFFYSLGQIQVVGGKLNGELIDGKNSRLWVEHQRVSLDEIGTDRASSYDFLEYPVIPLSNGYTLWIINTHYKTESYGFDIFGEAEMWAFMQSPDGTFSDISKQTTLEVLGFIDLLDNPCIKKAEIVRIVGPIFDLTLTPRIDKSDFPFRVVYTDHFFVDGTFMNETISKEWAYAEMSHNWCQ